VFVSSRQYITGRKVIVIDLASEILCNEYRLTIFNAHYVVFSL